jgi:L-methionine (R)-S-oxide reductase
MYQLKLPQKEGKLFSLLQKELGKTVPKDIIFKEIWKDTPDEATDWALNSLIYRLRKNTTFHKSGYIIENNKDIGYSLIKKENTTEQQSSPLLSTKDKRKLYSFVKERLASILKNETHMVSKMATINSILRENFPYYAWVGFYLVHNGALIIGPYQGTFACLDIPFGEGVCGTAARTNKTQIVPDVKKFPGHIPCDWRSQSEIVVPVFNNKKDLIAVFDVDSIEKNSFSETDKRNLEELIKQHFTLHPLEK